MPQAATIKRLPHAFRMVKAMQAQGEKKVDPIKREKPKVGRNAPCPCGSGKKYKRCCGRSGDSSSAMAGAA